MPRVLVTAQVPLIIAILTWRFVRSLRRDYELAPFVHHARGVRTLVRRPRHQHVSVPDPEQRHAADGGGARESARHSCWSARRVLVPLILGVHRVVVLGVPGQGRARGIPLSVTKKRRCARRLGWMALIWAMSVAALGVVSLLIRWWIK